MKYQISYQEENENEHGAVSAFLETQNISGSPGTAWEPENVSLTEAKTLLQAALKEGYYPTGDVTRAILSGAI